MNLYSICCEDCDEVWFVMAANQENAMFKFFGKVKGHDDHEFEVSLVMRDDEVTEHRDVC